MPDDLITVRDAAEAVGMKVKTLYSGMHSGQVPTHYRKGRRYVRLAEVKAWRERVAAWRRRVASER